MSIRTQLFALVAAFAVAFAAFMGLTWRAQTEHVEDSVFRPILDTKDLVADVLPPPLYALESQMVVSELLDARTPADRDALKARLKELQKQFDERHTFWDQTIEPGEQRVAIDAAAELGNQFYKAVWEQLVPLLDDPKKEKEAARVRHEVVTPLYVKHRAGIDEVVRLADVRRHQQTDTAAAAVLREKEVLVGIGVLTVLGTLLFGVFTARRIARRLDEVGALLGKVAKGDYSAHSEVTINDEIGRLQQALNGTITAGRDVFTELKSTAAEVDTASVRLAAATTEVSAGAQHQASLLQQTAAALRDLTGQVQENANQASRVNGAAQQTQAHARAGAEVMGQTQKSMEAITDASRKIEQIISVIDEFAFQTNMVALNAAVEAARAGEAGRGFAVVAAEVRSLAQRSAESAREVRGLVNDSISKVGQGTRLVAESQESYEQISEATRQLSTMVEHMTQSFGAQVTRIENISGELGTISSVTQQNAAQSEELSGMSESLRSQSEHLEAMTRRFILEANEVSAAAQPEAAFTPAARPSAPRPSAPGAAHWKSSVLQGSSSERHPS
jgi:methyl-accepting chemotaxis protein